MFSFADHEKNKIATKQTGAWTLFQAHSFITNEPLLQDILRMVRDLKLTYPGELAREMNMSSDTMKLHINLLIQKEFLIRYKVPRNPWGTLMACRVHDIWDMGKSGRGDFLKYNWITLGLKDQSGRWGVEEFKTFL